MESHLEARLWNDIFTFAEERVGIPHGTVRATALIETIPAAFEMEEILYELREHASGLNAEPLGLPVQHRQDVPRPGCEVHPPDRASVTMTAPFMRAYTDLLVSTCHRRGAFAIGGMAAAIPNRKEPGDHGHRAREGAGGQEPRGRRRLRRIVGGASRPRRHLQAGVRRRARRSAPTSWTDSATT